MPCHTPPKNFTDSIFICFLSSDYGRRHQNVSAKDLYRVGLTTHRRFTHGPAEMRPHTFSLPRFWALLSIIALPDA